MCYESLSLSCARFIRIEAASQLTHPDVEALIAAAIDQATTPLPAKGGADLSFSYLLRISGHVGGRRSDVGGCWDADNALGTAQQQHAADGATRRR
jgi:hypothetical protein